MGKLINAIVLAAALGVAYEMGRERGAREMFFKYTEAVIEAKMKEVHDDSNV